MTDEDKLEEIWKQLVEICKSFPVEIIIIPEQKKMDLYANSVRQSLLHRES